jgi:hypothetical protein
MYLAGILGLCALLPGPLPSSVSGGPALFDARPASAHSTPSQPASQQEAVQPASSKPETSPQPAQPGTPQPTPQQPAQAQPKKETKASPQAPTQKPAPAKPHATTKKKHTATVAGQPPPKKVVRQGSTADPTTQLAPGISQEQASRQRQTTTQLLSSTDAALQQLSWQQLNSDQQETVAQIRKFMQQSRAADKDGDSQLAYKLALKAHLLSDGLSKQ